MARVGDYRHRETKKPKKDAKKAFAPINIITPPVEVEVIKVKGKKPRDNEEEA